MSIKKKKFLKWFIIIFLIVASLAATVFIFFRNYEKNKIQEVNLVETLTSKEKIQFDTRFDTVLAIIEDEGKASWFEQLDVTNNKLDESLKVLSYYYIDSDGMIKDKDVSNAYSSMLATRSTLIDMFDEYIIKSTSEYFPSLIGANDIYLAFSNYLIKYAKVVKAVNENLISKEGFNSTSDVKFVMIDLYSRVVVDTFSNVETKNDLNVIKEDLNINKIDESFKFRYSYIDDSDAIGADVTEFIRYYNLCNKELFADKFVETISLATGIDENSTAEIKAAFYYNKIF